MVASVASLLVLVSACSIPSRPVWWPKPSKSHASVHRHSTVRANSDLAIVTRPWHKGSPELGIQVYWTGNKSDSDAVISAKARRIINYAISLNANSVALTFPFYTRGITASSVYADPVTTPSPAHIAIFLAQAAKSHLRVMLRPILNENALVAQNPNAWRGSIEPADRHAWFASYRHLLVPYAEAAQAGKAATFVVGAELDSLEGDPAWPGLIRAVRSAYHGQLEYDENFDEFAAHNTNLPRANLGVDAYPRFALSDRATVATLASAWKTWLGNHTASVRHRVVLSEVGIDAVAGSYRDPGAWLNTTTAPIDLPVQTKWYEAVCRATQAEQIAGVYWWEVSFDADPADPGPYESDRLTFLDRPAQQVISRCFARLSSETVGAH